MDLIHVLLLLLCIAVTIALTHLKKWLLRFSLKLGEKSHQTFAAKRRRRARMGKN